MAKNNARYINQDVINAYIAAGINPTNGSPARYDNDSKLKQAIKRQLRIIDEQDAVNRYIWEDLPFDLTSQELERLVYYRGDLCLFYLEEVGEFYVMPYALDGTIDFYGRYNTVHPVPMASGGTSDFEKATYKQQADLLANKRLKVLYDIPAEPLEGSPTDYCILLHDYTKQISQTIIPRQEVQDGLLDVMADCVPMMRTALLAASGIKGMRVGNEDDQSNVQAANKSLEKAALNGKILIPVVAQQEFQEITSDAPSKGEEYLMAMQSLDNFRLSTYGLENGGLFEKKQYQNTTQTLLNGSGQVGAPLQDGLSIRQHACLLANYLWGVGMSCRIAEQAAGMDLNADGLTADDALQGEISGENAEAEE